MRGPAANFNLWLNDGVADPALRAQVYALNLRGAVKRAELLCYFFCFGFASWGLTSFEFIHTYLPQVTLWDNLWPRLLFNSVPFLLVGWILRKTKIRDELKLVLWIVSLAAILNAAAWIYVWPIVMRVDPMVLGPVQAANTYTGAIVFCVVAPPNRFLSTFIIALGALFWIPLFAVTKLGGNHALFKMVLNDTLLSAIFNCWGSSMVNALRVSLALQEVRHRESAERFLGSRVSKAIFEEREDLLRTIKKVGFLLQMDIRGYTNMVKGHAEAAVSHFMSEYHARLAESLQRHQGFLHKSMGDGHLCSFGIMDDEPDLSVVPNIREEETRARRRRNQDLVKHAVAVAEDMFLAAQRAADKYFGDVTVHIGASVHYGEVELKVVDSSMGHSEQDIFGVEINKTSRLEEYTKVLIKAFPPHSSVIVLSPEAQIYLEDRDQFRCFSTRERPLRDFPDTQNVYARAYPSGKADEPPIAEGGAGGSA